MGTEAHMIINEKEVRLRSNMYGLAQRRYSSSCVPQHCRGAAEGRLSGELSNDTSSLTELDSRTRSADKKRRSSFHGFIYDDFLPSNDVHISHSRQGAHACHMAPTPKLLQKEQDFLEPSVCRNDIEFAVAFSLQTSFQSRRCRHHILETINR
nr:hypothetical protein CFP56_29888 [Quercus suber]